MSQKLRELIRTIRSCKTAAEERAVISKECALIRTAFKEDDNNHRHRNVAKLLFIHMLGYPTHFGQMECLKLIASPTFALKRVGYLGLTQLLDENTDVLMLVTNSIKNDLNHPNQYVNAVALGALGNIANPEMCRALANEVDNMMSVSNPFIKKKAALCAMRMARKAEELEDRFNGRITQLVEDKNHGVLLAGCSLLIELLETSRGRVEDLRKLVPSLIRSLKNMTMSGYTNAAEYEVSGVTDPFLQVKILKLLRLLGRGSAQVSDDMNDVLAQVATNTEGSKNAGNAILYECVQTIVDIEAESGLRVLGINILGRFLTNRDNNIRYVALQTLATVVKVDMKAVQRHRQTIVDCLKDPDVSIRKRALDVAYALITEDNIKLMTKELLNYLLVADVEFKEDLVTKICMAADKYAPSRRWQIDTLIKVMCLAGNYVRDEVKDSFIAVVAGTPQLHAYAAYKLYFSVREHISQEALVQTAVWCIGEFADLITSGAAVGPDNTAIKVSPGEILDLFATIEKRPMDKPHAKTTEYLVTATAKLASRITGELPRIKKMIEHYGKSMSVEVQQRSCEYNALMLNNWDALRDGILDRMPASERMKTGVHKDRPAGDATLDEVPTMTNGAAGGYGKHDTGSNSLLDLDDLIGGGPSTSTTGTTPAPSQGLPDLSELNLLGSPVKPKAVPAAMPPPAAGGDILDILGGLACPSMAAPAPLAGPSSAGGADLLLGLGGPAQGAAGMAGLLGDFGMANAHSSSSGGILPISAPKTSGGAGDLLDLLGGGGAPKPSAGPMSAPGGGVGIGGASSAEGGGLFGLDVDVLGGASAPAAGTQKFSAFEKGSLKVVFSVNKDALDPSTAEVEATFHNSGSTALTGFVFEAAVPKYLRLQMQPASSAIVGPQGAGGLAGLAGLGLDSDAGVARQRMKITNSTYGGESKPIIMKIRISYTVNGCLVQEQGQISNFPAGF